MPDYITWICQFCLQPTVGVHFDHGTPYCPDCWAQCQAGAIR